MASAGMWAPLTPIWGGGWGWGLEQCGELLWMDDILHHFEAMGNYLFGIDRGIIGLRWCELRFSQPPTVFKEEETVSWKSTGSRMVRCCGCPCSEPQWSACGRARRAWTRSCWIRCWEPRQEPGSSRKHVEPLLSLDLCPKGQ